MRKLILAVLCAVALSGCATTGGGGSVTDIAKQIQDGVRQACSFAPTINSILAILNKGGGSVVGVVNEICNAVTSAPLADGGRRKVVVRGVPVAGRRVR